MDVSSKDFEYIVKHVDNLLSLLEWRVGTDPAIDKAHRDLSRVYAKLMSYVDPDPILTTAEVWEQGELSFSFPDEEDD